jgi:hypothetical protein
VSRNGDRDETMEQWFRPKLMVADPFFCLKIGCLKATVRRVPVPGITSVDVKTGSPDTADFATTRLLIRRLWQFAQWLGRPLAYHGHHSAICQGTLPDMPQPADFGGFYFDPATDLLAYPAVTAVICPRSSQPLHELPMD